MVALITGDGNTVLDQMEILSSAMADEYSVVEYIG